MREQEGLGCAESRLRSDIKEELRAMLLHRPVRARGYHAGVVYDSIDPAAAWIEAWLRTSSCSMSTPFCTSAPFSAGSSKLRFFTFRIVAKRRQPRDARTTAVARPMPVDVPVISTDRIALKVLLIRRVIGLQLRVGYERRRLLSSQARCAKANPRQRHGNDTGNPTCPDRY
jgi:hypothetical protein